MRIRKRRAQEVDHSFSLQPSSSFAAAGNLQRKDHNERLEIGSERFDSGGGEAAALSLVLLAAETVPHAAQVASGQSTDKVRSTQEDSGSVHEPGSYITSSSEGELHPANIAKDKEILTQTAFEFEDSDIHPSNQPEGSLIHSLSSIFSELPRNVGLNVREALSKIPERSLSGLTEGKIPSLQVAKIMRSDPFFAHVRGGIYLTRSANIDFEMDGGVHDSSGRIQRSRGAKEHTDVGCGRVSSSSKGVVPPRNEKEVTSALESSSQVDDLGTRCTRVDGRSWQCRRRSLPGFSLCEHHHLQLSRQSRRQRNFQRAFNQSSRKRLRKQQENADIKGEAREGNRTVHSGRRKSRSLEAIAQHVGSVDSSSSLR